MAEALGLVASFSLNTVVMGVLIYAVARLEP